MLSIDSNKTTCLIFAFRRGKISSIRLSTIASDDIWWDFMKPKMNNPWMFLFQGWSDSNSIQNFGCNGNRSKSYCQKVMVIFEINYAHLVIGLHIAKIANFILIRQNTWSLGGGLVIFYIYRGKLLSKPTK